MHKRIKGSIDDTRWFDLQQGCTYTGFGKTTFRAWAKQIGAEVKIGRISRFDRKIIDQAMDNLVANNMEG